VAVLAEAQGGSQEAAAPVLVPVPVLVEAQVLVLVEAQGSLAEVVYQG